jgi:hypothetical protein
MKKRWAFTEELFFTLLVLALVLVFLVMAFGYRSQTRAFPLLATIPLTMALIIQVFVSARLPVGMPASTPESRSENFLTTAWMIGLILIIWVVGLLPSMFVIPLLYMKFYCGETWRPTLIVSTFLLVATWAFMHWLNVPDYPGVVQGLVDAARDGLGL